MGETNFRTREIPRSGSKAKDGERREKEEERKLVITITQCDNFILSNLPQQHWGGESAVIGRTVGGKQLAQARQGVGGNIRIKKPSDLQDQDQVRVRHRGESIKGKDSTNHLAVQPSYTDEEFILNKLEMHL